MASAIICDRHNDVVVIVLDYNRLRYCSAPEGVGVVEGRCCWEFETERHATLNSAMSRQPEPQTFPPAYVDHLCVAAHSLNSIQPTPQRFRFPSPPVGRLRPRRGERRP